MNPFNFPHSLKNIPLPSQMQYRRTLVSSIEKFVTRLRWDLIHRKNKTDGHTHNNYGFKTTAKPDLQHELAAFEDDLYLLAKNVEFWFKWPILGLTIYWDIRFTSKSISSLPSSHIHLKIPIKFW